MNLILFILICYGLTNIIVYGSLFEKLRKKWKEMFKTNIMSKLLECSMCISFHVGYIVFLLFWISEIKLFPNIYVGCFLFGCLSSGTSYILCQLFDDEGFKISKKE